ncbi:MAG: type II toxin-antitoxin system prevent-host-death family antitoxin [Candidatus Omnitrophota bacterium]|nr:type II toxin-antitoxin system prevent-host-death family antitoxin [Candidatus Omnitrophota bacterium]
MKFVNVRELKNKTSAVLHYTENNGDVIVTLRGKPCVVIHHISGDELEDYILLNHPEFKKKLKKAYQEYLSGETVDIDKLIEKAEKDVGRI